VLSLRPASPHDQRKGREHIKSDERILGDSDFVAGVLAQAKEKFDRQYELKRLGYDLGRVAARVGEIFGLKEEDILCPCSDIDGKNQRKPSALIKSYYL
jgi:hypothetical protein